MLYVMYCIYVQHHDVEDDDVMYQITSSSSTSWCRWCNVDDDDVWWCKYVCWCMYGASYTHTYIIIQVYVWCIIHIYISYTYTHSIRMVIIHIYICIIHIYVCMLMYAWCIIHTHIHIIIQVYVWCMIHDAIVWCAS